MRFAIGLMAAAIAMVSAPAGAAVVNLTFTQSGFGNGGTITGFFTGEDADGNGQLNSFEGEITDFGLSFSGNHAVEAFSLGFEDLFGLIYDLGDPLLGDGRTGELEGILAENGSFSYLVGPEPLGQAGACLNDEICGQINQGDAVTRTTELVVVGDTPAIPEPASWATMILGFGIAGAAVRNRRRPVTA